MRINLKTFELVAMIILGMGVMASLCEFHQVRWIGYVLSTGSVYLLYEIDRERARQRHRAAFYRRMGRIVESRLADTV